MCGAVTFTVANAPASFGACHCETCRRWTGSALMGFNVPETDITWKGEAHIKTLQSSDWAERAWCQRCGSSLYYRMTVDGPMAGSMQISLGLLDDLSGMTFDHELFVDCQPDAISYAGEGRDVMTRAEVFEKYGSGDDL
jgi:hypothetical protein